MRKRLPCLATSRGVAVALGGELVTIDILDKPTTLKKVWSRLAEGFALDTIELSDTGREATGRDVTAALGHMSRLDWQPVEPVGSGESYAAGDETMLAGALVFGGRLLHVGAAMLRVPTGQDV